MEKVDDEFNPRVGRITETHVRLVSDEVEDRKMLWNLQVHSDKNPMEAHKEYLREVKLSKYGIFYKSLV